MSMPRGEDGSAVPSDALVEGEQGSPLSWDAAAAMGMHHLRKRSDGHDDEGGEQEICYVKHLGRTRAR
jgi:hypothetical protein